MRKIIYTLPDGGVAVVNPVRNTYPVLEDLTDEEVEQRAWDRLPESAIDPQFVQEADLPADRSKRTYWKRVNGAVVVDEAAATIASIKAQLQNIDKQTGMVRGVRESILALGVVIEALREGPLPDLPSSGSGMSKLQAVEDIAKALRQQLAPQ